MIEKKKKAIKYTKNIDRSQAITTLLGKEHFIWRGRGRVEAEQQFLPFFSAALICRRFFFFCDNCTRIFIAFYHSPGFISLIKSESSTLVPQATVE